MDAGEFLEQLRRSRLVTEEALAVLRQRFGADADVAEMIEVLIAEGALTPYQARRISAGKAAGLVLGPYRLLDEIGSGGMGRVYRALHTVMDRVVALKVILPELTRHALAEEWFNREVRAVTKLSHPNVVTAYDAGFDAGVHYLAMELVDGVSLDNLVWHCGPLPVAAACELVAQAARALQAAHEQGLVHRDVKPANLLVLRWYADALADRRMPPRTDAVAVKVVDFGLARLQGATAPITLPSGGSVVGTPDYMAPEQARSLHAADGRSDLYSLGCTLFFALTGRTPFGGDGAVDKAIKHLMDAAPRVESFRPEVPLGVGTIVARLLEKDPADRIQTAAELVRELAPWSAANASVATAVPVPRASVPVVETPPESSFGLHVSEPAGARPGPSLSPMLPRGRAGAPSHTQVLVPTAVAAAAHAPQSEWVVRVPKPSSQAPIDPALRRDWRRWSALVAAAAAGRRPRAMEAEYRDLYGRLIAASRDHAERATGEGRLLFDHLEKLVRPWLTLHVLERTEPALLRDLRERCRAVEPIVGTRSWPAAVLVAAVIGAGPLLVLLGSWLRGAVQLP